MTNEAKVALTNAVYDVYTRTSPPRVATTASKTVELSVNDGTIITNKMVVIARHETENEVLYKLYINEDKEAFMTVFGFWPIGFVADIFIKALEHYYDWY